MCGFIGRIKIAGLAGQAPPLSSGLGFLRRRGPDSCHYWHAAEGPVELIQARLAIVDADSRADQPYSQPEYRLTVAFNGEIYNYEELRRELSGHHFRTRSDTEVLVAAFARWGVAGLKRLRGMFSCALVDERARRVYLVRDPVGKKPLYVASWPGGVLFGSTLLALASAVGEPPAVAEEALPHFWQRGYIAPTQAVLAGARPLAPGEVLELDFEGTAVRQWDCFPERPQALALGFGEAQDRVQEALGCSLQRRLHNNPDPVSLLSGGIDSTVVTCLMHRMAQGSAITLGSLVPFGLDEKYARYAAWRNQIPLEVLKTQYGHLADDVGWSLDLQDEPLGMISFFPLTLLLRTAKEYGRILLTGDGGDEVFLGYGRPAEWTNPDHRSAEFSEAERRVVVGVPAPAWMSPWGQFTVGHSLLGHMLPKLDRASAEQGVEVRCPLLDWDLLALVRSLGPDVVLHGGKPKALLKGLLGGWPGWFVNRTKVGFAYHLRWAWGVRRFAGLRELVLPDAAEAFGAAVPPPLRGHPRHWRSWDIFRNFGAAWKLLVWSRFRVRLSFAREAARKAEDAFAGSSGSLPALSVSLGR